MNPETDKGSNGTADNYHPSCMPAPGPDHENDRLLLKNAEHKLHLSEIKVRALSEAIPDLIFRLDREGVYLDYKASNTDLYYQIESIIGKKNREITPPDFAVLIDNKIKLTLETGEMQFFEYQLYIPDRGLCSYEVRMVPNGQDEVLAIVRDNTSHKITDQALHESKVNVRAIINSVSDGLMLISRDGTIIDSNETNAKCFGYTASEITGKKLSDLALHSDLQIDLKAMVFDKGETIRSDIRFNDRWYEYCIQPVKNSSGLINRAVISGRDVTQQKQTFLELESALKKNKENLQLLESLINSIPDIIGIQDNQYRIIRYNKAGYEFFNTTPEDVRGKKCYQMTERDQACEQCAASTAYLTKKPAHLERYYPEKKVWLDIRSYPITDENGDVKLVIKHLRDITHIKDTEVALRTSKERYRELFNSSAGGILIGSPEGFIVQVNSTFLKMTGYSADALTGRHISESIFTKESLRAFPFRFDLLKQGKTVSSERTIIAADNRHIQVEMHTHILPDGTYQSIYHDITERKRSEEEINRQNEALRKMIAEKDKFFSIIAHDLRSPFTSFLGLTEIMDQELETMSREEIRFYSAEMKKSAANLYNLLENLLEWSMIQRNMKTFNPQKLNLRAVANHSTEALQEAARSKQIEVTMEIPEEIMVTADQPMLETVFRNLFSNAVKFTGKGGAILLTARETGNDIVEVSIKDNGIGIPESMIGTIFSISGKNNRPGTMGEPSTGLGLLLCKEFIEKNGGKIKVESKIKEGSCFCFTLPGC